jgi:hypothetical protein
VVDGMKEIMLSCGTISPKFKGKKLIHIFHGNHGLFISWIVVLDDSKYEQIGMIATQSGIICENRVYRFNTNDRVFEGNEKDAKLLKSMILV